MKKQTRSGVFETNSSSVHTLSIRKNKNSNLIWDVLRGMSDDNNGVLKAGITKVEEVKNIICEDVLDISQLPIQTTIDILFYGCFSDCDMICDVFDKISKFISVFEKHGITIETSVNEISKSYNEMVWLFTDDLKITELLKKSCSLEEGIEQILSSERCVYTCYEDDTACGCPSDIEEVYNEFSNIPENEKITASERC